MFVNETVELAPFLFVRDAVLGDFHGRLDIVCHLPCKFIDGRAESAYILAVHLDDTKSNVAALAEFEDILTDSVDDKRLSRPGWSIEKEVGWLLVANRDAKVLCYIGELYITAHDTFLVNDLIRFEQ